MTSAVSSGGGSSTGGPSAGGARVLIVGGGISGLSTGFWLLRELERQEVAADVELVEASSRIGGTLGTESREGFVFERGPNGFLDNGEDTLELVRELGLEDELRSAAPSAENRFLLRGGRLHALPKGPGPFLRSPLVSLRGKLRVLTEPFRGAGSPSEEDSVASFGRRRFGREIVNTFLDPLVTGIYAGDVERLSLQSAFPRMAEMERQHGSVFKAMKATRRAKKEAEARGEEPPRSRSPFGAKLCSFRAGLESLSSSLAGRLRERLRTNCAVESLRPGEVRPGEARLTVRYRSPDPGSDGVMEDYDHVVLATPASRSASLVAARCPELARVLEAIPYAPVVVVCLGYRREDVGHELDGYGFLIPRSEGLRTLGAIFTSSLFPEHAPAGCVSLRVMIGGARDPDAVDLSADELVALAVGELREVLRLSEQVVEAGPVERQVYRYTRGIPQYNVGHRQRLDRIEDERRKIPGLWLTGNAYRGVGINDCVREAKRLSGELTTALRACA